jgi:hypothetical protein
MDLQFTITEGSAVQLLITEETNQTLLEINELSSVAFVIYEGPGQPSIMLDDLEMNVGDTGMDLYGGSLTLPAGWIGKRIRVFRNGIKMKATAWSRTTNGFDLVVSGDVWTDVEYTSIENY